MGMEIDHQFWDGFWAVVMALWFFGLGVWVWRRDSRYPGPKPFWKTLAYFSFIWAFGSAAQLAARGLNEKMLFAAVSAWALLTAVTALLLGVRHFLSRRDSRQIAD